MSDERSVVEQAADVVFYAPVGFALEARRLVPEMAERGRRQVTFNWMVGRYAVWSSENVPYLGLQLREQGRIAALAGDEKRAARAYRHYLAMRADAEPSVKPQIDSVRRELAKLGN